MAEKLIPLEDAQSIVLSHVAPTDLVEIPVWQAAGFPLAEDAVADIDISPFANSAMDGYAVRAADLAAAAGDTPVTLSVVGHEAAGHVFEGAIGAGETVRIMTGAPVPEGADAVVKYEIVDVLDGDGNEGSHVSFSAPAKVGENVRSAAEEAHAGDVVMHAGEVAAPARTHATVQLDTSAAAFVAEKAREAAAEAAREAEKPARRRRGKLLGEPKPEAKLPGGVVQPSLPFGEPEPTSEPSSEQETPAAEQATAAETVAPAPEATPAATEAASESNDRLAAMMRRSARREEAYVPTSQLRRFTLPDSAPIMRRVMGFLSDQARTLIHAGVSRDRICIDPGPGFGKSANEDIVIQRETAKMASLGYPLMCAVSRKRFVGAVSGVTEAAERDAATFGVCLGAIQAGANIVRVHDAAGFAQFLNGYWAVAKPQPRRAFVAVGSNLGHRCDNIRAAREMIAEIPLTCVSNSSKIYESEPAYETRQDAFANAVIEIKTELAPLVLLDELMKIEAELGRDRSKKAKANGPRTIDLDLLWMDGETHGGKKLRLPHPLIGERDFVLVPLEDLMHDPARFFRYNGVEVKEPEDRVGHIVGELGRM